MKKTLTILSLILISSVGFGQFVPNGSHIYYNAGNVSIGTQQVGAKLLINRGSLTRRFSKAVTAIEINNRGDQTAILQANGRAPYRIVMQDGFGRISHLWNAYDAGNTHKYDISDEAVAWFRMGNRAGFEFKTAPGGTEGNDIEWNLGLKQDIYGNVGIGKRTPEYKLDVSGDINFTQNLLKNGNPIPAMSITDENITNWSTAFSWGDHSTVGYINESFLTDNNYLKYDAESNLQLIGGLKDTDGDLGTAGQVLSSTSEGTDWIDAGADGKWKTTSNDLTLINPNINRVIITNNSDMTLTEFMAINTNDESTYSGAVIVAKGSGPEYTNNMYFGKYSKNFYISSWAGNGVMATDKDLIIAAVGSENAQNPNPDPKIIFQTGGGYTGPQTKMILDESGTLCIGTPNTTNDKGPYKLTVEGKILSTEVTVIDINAWPDFVFAPSYQLLTLKELENYIKTNNHLPDVPSEKEVKENGINLGETDAVLLRKIEELTLYTIDQEKKINAQNEKIRELENQKEVNKKQKEINEQQSKMLLELKKGLDELKNVNK